MRTCVISRHASVRPERLALRELLSGASLTYRQLDDAIARCAAWLVAQFPEGARIALLGRNSLDHVLLFYACARVGRVFVPVNWRLSGEELKVLVEDCEPVIFLYQAEFAAAARTAVAGSTAQLMATEPTASAVVGASAGLTPRAGEMADPTVPACLIYTSGTTGRPKGVIITRRGALAAAGNWRDLSELTPASAMLLDAPLFHIIGLLAIMAGTLLVGGTLVVSDRFEPVETLRRLTAPDLAITHYFGVPQMAQAIADLPAFETADLSRLRAVFSGGAPLAPALIEAYLARDVLLVNGFGMSEFGSGTGMPLDADLIRAHMGSVGVAAPAMELRIVTPDGRDAEPGETGEILIRSPALTPGYWNRPEATASAIRDGWLRTGDAASRDENGYIRLLDRYKDMYITGGENVYPAEIEVALMELHGVAEAAVVGVPDPRWGESGVAFIALREGAQVTAEQVMDFCVRRLARYKKPAQVRFVDALPRTGSGKVTKDALRALFATETSDKEDTRHG